MTDIADATPAYRGYRLQALYVLYRILTSDSSRELVFHPEGKEDLSILDSHGTLLEICQVKAYSSNLILSDFKPDKSDSFFYRMSRLLPSIQGATITIVS